MAVLLRLAAIGVGIVLFVVGASYAWNGSGDFSLALGGGILAAGGICVGWAFRDWYTEPRRQREQARTARVRRRGGDRDSEFSVRASRSDVIRRRFRSYLGVALGAAVIYCLVFSLPLFFLLKDRLGESMAWVVAIGSSLISVALLVFLYVRYVCNELAKSHFTLTDESLVVAGIRSSNCVEVAFACSDIRAVVYGERLSGMERVLDKLHTMGVPRVSQKVNKDLRAGRLAVIDSDHQTIVFHFVNKAFSERDLVRAFEALADRGVLIELVDGQPG